MNLSKKLPLTETTYYILLALYQEGHGYAIMQRVEELSGGTVRIAAGTMYGALDNLLNQKLILSVSTQDKRRKVYKISSSGIDLIELEVNRLKHLISTYNLIKKEGK